MEKKKNLLIVEDELFIAWDIKELLELNNINVQIVKDFDSAINNLAILKPDFVLIDVYLGKGKTGLDLGKLLSDDLKIPFIYLTSYNDTKTIQNILETKPYAFITKPFKKVDLLTTIQIAFNYYNNKVDLNNFKDKVELENVTFIVKKVLNYIDENIEKKIEIDDLVVLTKWSRHHFVRMFTSQMSISPYCYVLKVKMEHAKIMILKKNTKLESIAYDLGFQSYVNFARTFKNYTNYSPKEFRKLN